MAAKQVLSVSARLLITESSQGDGWAMSARQPLPADIGRLLDTQGGVVLVSQLLAAGLTRRVCQRVTSSWTRLASGLYLERVPGFESAAWAGVLQAGPAGVVGSAAAAHLAGVLRDPPDDVVVWSTHHRSPLVVGPWQVRFRRGLRNGRGSPLRLPVEAGLIDLARDVDEIGAIDAVARALARGLTTPARILDEVSSRQRVRHARAIRELCTASGGGIESGLEWLFQRDVLSAHGLPTPQRQVKTGVGRVDCRYDAFGLIVELDGMRDHSDWSKDMIRDNEHVLRSNEITLRYGWGAATRQACLAAGQMGAALRPRGWSGRVRECRRCAGRPLLEGRANA